MKKETIQNIVDNIILKRLEEYYFISSAEVVEILEFYAENSEDLDELLELVFNSKRYNYILLQNGDGYIFSSTNIKCIRAFFEDVPINDNDQCWNCYVYKNNYSMTLLELYGEVM